MRTAAGREWRRVRKEEKGEGGDGGVDLGVVEALGRHLSIHVHVSFPNKLPDQITSLEENDRHVNQITSLEEYGRHVNQITS